MYSDLHQVYTSYTSQLSHICDESLACDQIKGVQHQIKGVRVEFRGVKYKYSSGSNKAYMSSNQRRKINLLKVFCSRIKHTITLY